MKALFVSLLFAMLFVSSCNKDETGFTDTTPTEKLSNKDWRLLQTGFDDNGNGTADFTELHYSDSNNVIVNFHLYDNGTGTFSYYQPAGPNNGSANLTWSLDPTNIYITSNIPSLGKTTVSKIMSLTNMNFSVVADTSQHPYWFLYFIKESGN